ncbi:hypothetical protein MSAN_00687000 [Mycena sanguinolenta]|uniref:Uncharacterized protein n=1 Tax=Mycena sanguinolenta TaxID=230812 RepID=A0A8H6Z0S6_9AGAR|nr:hypothetical protein MSAN_00687000 [Mycena sanguinolenta]
MRLCKLQRTGNAAAHLNYGFYLEGSIFPFNIDSAYIYANSDASASLGFEISGRATVKYDSGRVGLIPEIAWPGLKWPGIVTIGPTFNIYGQLLGTLSASGTFGTTAKYTFPEGHVAYGLVGDTDTPVDESSGTDFGQQDVGWTVQPTLDIQLGGSLAVHVIPEAAVVFDVFPGTPLAVGARAYITIDGAIIASFSADLTGVNARVDAQVDFLAGADGGLLSSESAKFTVGPYNFFHQDWNIYNADLSFTPSPDRRSLGYSPNLAAVPSWALFSANDSYAPMLESSLLSRGILHDRSLFSGLLSCPASKNTTAGAGNCAKALADPNPDPDPDDGINEQFRKRDDSVHRLAKRVIVPGCTGLQLTPPNYRNTIADGIWDLSNLGSLATTVADWGQKAADTGYAQEHVYEMQLLAQFMTEVVTAQVPLNGMTACAWLKKYVFTSFGSQGVKLANALEDVQPSGDDSMPVLLALANSAKEAFFAGRKDFRTLDNMEDEDKSASDVMMLLRAGGAAASYMQNARIQLALTQKFNAISQLWINFFAEYKANVDPNLNYDVAAAHRTWMNGLLSSFNTNAAGFLADAKTALKGKFPTGQNTIEVALPIEAMLTFRLYGYYPGEC